LRKLALPLLTFTRHSMRTRHLLVLVLSGACAADVAPPTQLSRVGDRGAVSDSRPGFDLAIEPSSVTLAPGGSATAAITVGRDFPFRRDVVLSIASLPPGVTAVVDPATVEDVSATVTFTAVPGAGPIVADVTVAGEALGHVTATASIQLTVKSPLTPISLDFCASDPALWFAYRNEDGPWTRVVPDANGTVTFDASERVSIAYTRQKKSANGFLGLNYITSVQHVTAQQLQPLSGVTCVSEFGSKTINGDVTGLSAGETAVVSLHVVQSSVISASAPSYRVQRKPDNGALDLVGVRRSSTGLPVNVIIRRGLILENEAVVPTLDFAGAEAIAMEYPAYSVTGLRGSSDMLFVDFWTGSGPGQMPTYQRTVLRSGSAVGALGTYPAVPASLLAPGDRHELTLRSGPPQDAVGAAEIFAAGSPRSLAIGPSLATPSLTQSASAGGPLFTAEVASQPEYGGMARFIVNRFGNGLTNVFIVDATSEYLGGTPPTWTLVMPDFSAVEGWNTAWGYVGGVVLTPEVHAFSASSVDIAPPWLDLTVPPLARTFGNVSSVRFASRRLAFTAAP
jgi:hypothetical protein